MNRKDRRAAGKAEKPKTYNITQEQLDQMQQLRQEEIEQIREKATRDSLTQMLVIPLVVLRDKFGFGQVRADRFMRYVMLWIDGLDSGEVTMEQLQEICKEAYGVTIEMDDEEDGRAKKR